MHQGMEEGTHQAPFAEIATAKRTPLQVLGSKTQDSRNHSSSIFRIEAYNCCPSLVHMCFAQRQKPPSSGIPHPS
jgi:hypothetical protein